MSNYAGQGGGRQAGISGKSRYIGNGVIHIADYYAPVIGEFEQVVLLTLVRLGNGAYGATIRREITERTGREVPIGSVYVTLARLEKKGMVVRTSACPRASAAAGGASTTSWTRRGSGLSAAPIGR